MSIRIPLKSTITYFVTFTYVTKCYLDCWPHSQAFRDEREGIVHTVCACVNFMNAHVMKNCGRVYGNGLKRTHAVFETENCARVYKSDI